jgi:hypothetical protein
MVSVSCLPLLELPITRRFWVEFSTYFLWGILVFLQGFLAKASRRTWFPDGEHLVECW